MIKVVPLTDKRRSAKRSNFMLLVSVSFDGKMFWARVRDLAPRGLKLELKPEILVHFAPETAVTVGVRGVGDVPGTIAWRRGAFAGVALAQEIDPKLALKPVGKGETTPNYVRPVLVPDRKLKRPQSL